MQRTPALVSGPAWLVLAIAAAVTVGAEPGMLGQALGYLDFPSANSVLAGRQGIAAWAAVVSDRVAELPDRLELSIDGVSHWSVKNHINAYHNPYAQKRHRYTVGDVRSAPMVAWPLTRLDICVMSDGAAAVILASEEGVRRMESAGARIPRPLVRVTGIGRGTDAMRMSDRPHVDYDTFLRDYATEQERSSDQTRAYYRRLWGQGTRYPGVHSFRAGRTAGNMAYRHAGISDPLHEVNFIELHDAYTSSEIQTYEDLGLCRYGEGGPFAVSGRAFMPGLDYGLQFPEPPVCPVNPSGGLIACGHPVGATGLMQGVFAIWQLQGTIEKHFGDGTLQVRGARRGAIHSHAGTGTYVTVSILEREE